MAIKGIIPFPFLKNELNAPLIERKSSFKFYFYVKFHIQEIHKHYVKFQLVYNIIFDMVPRLKFSQSQKGYFDQIYISYP